jgi:multidrug resistance efflux pump
MLELLLCSLVTVFPDYLYRRFAQGKRIGREITLYSVWYELRWGITACLLLTIALITTIFYFHPATKFAVSYFRTVPILSEGSGRVEEVFVGIREQVKAGQPLFKLDSSVQEAAVETARRRIAEADATIEVSKSDLLAADGKIYESENALQQARDEYETKAELFRRNSNAVPAREVESLKVLVEQRQGALTAVMANKSTLETHIASLLPAEKARAEAELAEAEAQLAKMVVYAGVDGMVEQFTLRAGDIVNPFMRPAGVLVPSEGQAGDHRRLRADRGPGDQAGHGRRGRLHVNRH